MPEEQPILEQEDILAIGREFLAPDQVERLQELRDDRWEQEWVAVDTRGNSTELVVAMEDWESKTVDLVRNELAKCHRRILRHPWVTAVDIGYPRKNGAFFKPRKRKDEDDQALPLAPPAIRIHLKEKKSLPQLEHERWPASQILRSRLALTIASDGAEYLVPIDVIPAQYFVNQQGDNRLEASDPEFDRRSHVNPLVGGISVGNCHGGAGTLGAIVWDLTDRTPCILANWHVLAGRQDVTVGETCLQPSVLDGGRPDTDGVAKLKRSRLDKSMDAALAQLTGAREYSVGDVLSPERERDGCLCRIRSIRDPELGMKLVKYSRSSGPTRGFIDGVFLSVKISYGWTEQTFEDQIHIVANDADDGIASEAGDSGAIWVQDGQHQAVGLHLGGETLESPLPDFAIASPLGPIAEVLEFSFTPVFDSHKETRDRKQKVDADARDELRSRLRALEDRVLAGAGASYGTGGGGLPITSGSGGGGRR